MNYSYEVFKALKQKNITAKIRILTGSMSPWILPGAYVKVQPCLPEDLNPFDIVVFWRDEKLICHSFIKRTSFYIRTAALNQDPEKLKSDPPWHPSHLLGRVVEPKFKFYHKWMLRLHFRKVL